MPPAPALLGTWGPDYAGDYASVGGTVDRWAGAGRLPGWVDRLSYRGGVLYAHHADPQPWSGPVVSLGDCNPGDLVFLEHGKDAVGQSAWMLWQVVEGGAAPAI